MRKIKSFTIIELLVAMSISGIVISMALLMFLQFRKYVYDYSTTLNRHNEILLLVNQINLDFDKFNIVEIGNYSTVKLENENELIEYYIDEDFIIRESDIKTDTFKIKTEDLELKFLDVDENIIKSIYFSIIIDKELTYPVLIKKEYANQVLFEYDTSEKLISED